jgi:hypothetical protein
MIITSKGEHRIKKERTESGGRVEREWRKINLKLVRKPQLELVNKIKIGKATNMIKGRCP